jgi:hypothetical protein
MKSVLDSITNLHDFENVFEQKIHQTEDFTKILEDFLRLYLALISKCLSMAYDENDNDNIPNLFR